MVFMLKLALCLSYDSVGHSTVFYFYIFLYSNGASLSFLSKIFKLAPLSSAVGFLPTAITPPSCVLRSPDDFAPIVGTAPRR